jgi:hypothetical protein
VTRQPPKFTTPLTCDECGAELPDLTRGTEWLMGELQEVHEEADRYRGWFERLLAMAGRGETQLREELAHTGRANRTCAPCPNKDCRREGDPGSATKGRRLFRGEDRADHGAPRWTSGSSLRRFGRAPLAAAKGKNLGRDDRMPGLTVRVSV